MTPSRSGTIADRPRKYKARKKAPVHRILDRETLNKYRRTVLDKTFLVLMSGLFSFVSSAAGIPAPDGGNTNGNTAEGTQALFSNTTGNANTAIGVGALYKNTTGTSNTATGMAALGTNTTGFSNTAIGAKALLSATGNYNVALGDSAGESLTTGDNNIDIGYNVFGVKGDSNTIRIGNSDIKATYMTGISGQTVVAGAAVFVDPSGKLGTMSASTRFSDEIKPMEKASEAILTLKPVTFRYKQEIDPRSIRQFGLIAEEVEKVDPDLVGRDEKGKVYSVRYDAVNAMLLNEFLKEHRKVREQEATITQIKSTLAKQDATITHQQKQIEALTAGLQKVNAQLESSKPVAQAVNNNQ